MPNKREESTSLAEFASTEHRGQMSAADVGIKFRRNGRRKERHGMPHNERCERGGYLIAAQQTKKTANQICRERKKKPACLDRKQAGFSTHRVIGLSRERKGVLFLYTFERIYYFDFYIFKGVNYLYFYILKGIYNFYFTTCVFKRIHNFDVCVRVVLMTRHVLLNRNALFVCNPTECGLKIILPDRRTIHEIRTNFVCHAACLRETAFTFFARLKRLLHFCIVTGYLCNEYGTLYHDCGQYEHQNRHRLCRCE